MKNNADVPVGPVRGGVKCALDREPGVALATDDAGAAWLCRSHLRLYELQRLSIGRTVSGVLREQSQ